MKGFWGFAVLFVEKRRLGSDYEIYASLKFSSQPLNEFNGTEKLRHTIIVSGVATLLLASLNRTQGSQLWSRLIFRNDAALQSPIMYWGYTQYFNQNVFEYLA